MKGFLNSRTSIENKLPSWGLSGTSAITRTCSMALFAALLLFQACKPGKHILQPGDKIYPNRFRTYVEVGDSTARQLEEVFVYYNAETGRMDTTSIAHAVACLGMKPYSYLTYEEAQGLVSRFSDDQKEKLKRVPPFGEQVYRSVSDARGNVSPGYVVRPAEDWLHTPTVDEVGDAAEEDITVLSSHLVVPDTLDPVAYSLLVDTGADLVDATHSATYVTFVDMALANVDSTAGSPYTNMMTTARVLDDAASTAASVATSMEDLEIPQEFVVPAYDTTQAALDYAYGLSYSDAGYYRRSEKRSALADLVRQQRLLSKSYTAYTQTCPQGLDAWRMFGANSLQDVSYATIQAKTNLENAEWPEDTAPVSSPAEPVDTSSAENPENCSTLQRTSAHTFQVNSTCEGIIFSVSITNTGGGIVWTDSNVQSGEEVNFDQHLVGKPAGIYYVHIFGPNYGTSFSVEH